MMEMKEEEGTHAVFYNEVVTRHLFSFLDVATLKTCRLVNSLWKDLSSTTFFRRTILDIHRIQLKQADFPYEDDDEDYYWSNDRIAKLRWSRFSREVLNFITKHRFHHPHISMDHSFMLRLRDEGTIKTVLQGIKRLEFHEIERYAYRDEGDEFLPHVTRILTHVGSQLEELTVQGACRMRDLDGSIFPQGINFSRLRALSLKFPCFDEGKMAAFLSRIFNDVQNLEELSIANRGYGLKRILDSVDFNGLKKISKLTLENLNGSDSGVVDFVLENFVELTCLTLKDMVVYTNNSGWSSFAKMLTSLLSMLTLKSLELHVAYIGDEYLPVFSVLPCFANLEELTLRVEWSAMRGPEGPRFHWETALDEIDYGKSFPKLQKLTLYIEEYTTPFGNTVSSSSSENPISAGSVCPTLKMMTITCPDLEKWHPVILTDGIRNKLCHKFPNAKIFFMGKFVDLTVLRK